MTDKSDDKVGHLNTILARGGGNLNDPIFKSSNARGLPGGGMLKFRVDRRITFTFPIALTTNHKLHITGEMVAEHKLGSFSDGVSLCFPVFLDRHVGYWKVSKTSRYLFSLVAVANPINSRCSAVKQWNSACLRILTMLSLRIVNKRQWVKPDKFLCYMFLLAFLALTVHRRQ